ncbi:MAG: hypothetical protein RL341_2141 [Pseudomonadota bacterium]
MRRGRPVSQRHSWVLDYLREHPQSPQRALRAALGMPPRAVERLVDRMKRSGVVQEVGRAQLPGARRPVALYSAAQVGDEGVDLQRLLCGGLGRTHGH